MLLISFLPMDPKAKRVQLYAVSFFLDIVGHAFPLVVSYEAHYAMGASPFELGLLGSTWTVVYAATCFATASWSDRFGSMRLIWPALAFLALVLFPAVLLASRLAHLFLANALFGAALALFWPPLQRQLSLLSTGKTLWRALGAFNLSWAAGSIAGTLAGGAAAYESVGFSGILVLLITVAIAGLVSSAGRWVRQRPEDPRAPMEAVDPRRARLFVHLGRSANFCASFAMGGVHMVFPYIEKGLLLTAAASAAILTAKEIARLAAFAFLRWSPGWHYSLGWLAGLQLAGAGAMVACGFVKDSLALFVLFIPLGLFSGLAYYSSLYYGLNLRADEGRSSAVHEGILATGVVLGPLACGGAGHLFPDWPGSALVAVGAVLAAGLLFEIALVRLAELRRRREGPVEPA